MTGFLVIVRHDLDDLPIRLLEDLETAKEFAESCDEHCGDGVADLLGLDATTPQALWIYEFQAGCLVNVQKVKELEIVKY
jgi:hypothetical protein